MLSFLLYHILTISQMVADDPAAWKHLATHIQVTGYVTYVASEDDGDAHIRLCDAPTVRTMDRNHCIVAEIIPAIPLERPRKGQKITVQGISRYDAESPGHHWFEVHPVISITKEK